MAKHMNESAPLYSKLLKYVFMTLEVFFLWLICVVWIMTVLISSRTHRVCLPRTPILQLEG